MCLSHTGVRAVGCVVNVFLFPSISIIGVALNILCLVVFSSHRSHPLVPALSLLSLCDLLQLFLSLFVLFIPALIDFYELSQHSWMAQIAFISTGFLSPLLLASNCASIWTITYISIERHRAITKPLQTVQSVPQIVPLILITLAALLFNASKWTEFSWVWEKTERDQDEIRGFLDVGPEYMLKHNTTAPQTGSRYTAMRELVLYPVLVYLLPLCLLTCLNLRILIKISLTRLTSTHRSRIAQERRTISLLIAIVLLFFCCHTGGLVIRFIEQSEGDWYVLCKDMVNLLFNVNSMANPMLYFLFTRQFRDLRERYIAAHFYSSSSSRPSLAHIHHSSTTTRSSVLLDRSPHYFVLECREANGQSPPLEDVQQKKDCVHKNQCIKESLYRPPSRKHNRNNSNMFS